jgi:threonylcarbamoyladenosine tRNA methylthiotransferase MtaB
LWELQGYMKIHLDSVGCRLNQSEIEAFARQFRAAGHELVPLAASADLAVINTCAVTAAAGADSRKLIRRAHRSGAGEVVVTGCWATLNPGAAEALPGVGAVIANQQKDGLVPDVLQLPPEIFDQEPLVRQPVPGARLRTRAFIKVQDGCDNRCTFCVTTVARGASRSRPAMDVIADVTAAVLSGAQEVVLTGVHLGAWGHDLSPPQELKALVQAILDQTEIPRLRLSSLEPWDLDAGFFRLWEDKRLCRHLHLPLQSGSQETLRRMARKTTPESFTDLLAAARAVEPQMAITTDVITGFPGETETEFLESLRFVEAAGFAGGHVFTYSARPGTAAAKMPGQVPHPVRKERNARIQQALAASGERYQDQFLGTELDVLWESAAELGPQLWTLSGLTDNYLRVSAQAPREMWNAITPVRLKERHPHSFQGELVGM